MAGTRIWDQQGKFKLRVGPLGYGEFTRLLPGGDARRVLLYPKQEIGIHQETLECELHPRVERAAVMAPSVEKREQRLHVPFGCGPAICQARYP